MNLIDPYEYTGLGLAATKRLQYLSRQLDLGLLQPQDDDPDLSGRCAGSKIQRCSPRSELLDVDGYVYPFATLSRIRDFLTSISLTLVAHRLDAIRFAALKSVLICTSTPNPMSLSSPLCTWPHRPRRLRPS